MQLVKNSRLLGLLNATSLLTFLKNTVAYPQSCSVTLFFKEDTCDGEPFVAYYKPNPPMLLKNIRG